MKKTKITDKQRLDWLTGRKEWLIRDPKDGRWIIDSYRGDTPRRAIDLAMKAESDNQGQMKNGTPVQFSKEGLRCFGGEQRYGKIATKRHPGHTGLPVMWDGTNTIYYYHQNFIQPVPAGTEEP